MGIIDAIAKEVEAKKREAREFNHKKYRDNFLDLIYNFPKKFIGDVYALSDPMLPADSEENSLLKPVDYTENKTITCCPEPLEFITIFNDYVDDQAKCKSIMYDLINGNKVLPGVQFKKVVLDHQPKDGIWFNTTANGVNLRPGLLDGEMGQPFAVTMGDLAVHGVVVGRTGSGKSVFLNNLIFNLLTEYAPWELDLYLADFKKVELSRYMSKYKTPHLKTCAATSEIRYIITMLSHIVDCMQARQDLFTRLGIQKISEFRKKYNVVLPRVVLLVDEFQQMFQEATNHESGIISDLLMSIIKLGRATGFHLLFASQEMSGALSGKALANFKIRFALPCDSSVSSDILGNAAAATLERGFVLANMDSGKAEQNKTYKVPFIPDDEEFQSDGTMKESYFYKILCDITEEAETFHFNKNKTFYQEDAQIEINRLEKVLARIKEQKAAEIAKDQDRYFDIITLGRGVVYSHRKYDLETFFIEKGRNKNIFALCPDVDDLAYLEKLLAINFKYSPNTHIQHIYFDFNPILSAKYQISSDLENVNVCETQEELECINGYFVTQTALMEASKQRSIPEFIQVFIAKMIEGLGNKEGYTEIKKKMLEIFSGVSLVDVEKICNEKMNEDPNYGGYLEPVLMFYKHVVEGISWDILFPPKVFWISGIEYVESMPKWFLNVMRNGMAVNMLFLLFSASEDINKIADIVGRCDYLFASGNNEKIYNKCGMRFTKKSRNSIVIDFKIKSLNTERAFKRYKVQANHYEVPSLNFDLLNVDDLMD